MSVSALILTLNEESNLAACLESVAWSDDVVVFDSCSTDKTVEIAKDAGVRVVQRKFDNWSSHQNWAIRSINFKNPWVFYLDADERCDELLVAELQSFESNNTYCCAYQVRRKDHFMGKWLRRAQLYPTWITRLFRPEKIRYERLVNPVVIVDGEVDQLSGHLIHYPFSHGICHWYARHNNYSDMEALDLIREKNKKIEISAIFNGDYGERRNALKQLAYRMPFRPSLVFCYLYFFRLGFLDGIPGLTYCRLRSMYEYMIDLKVRELRRREKGLPV